MALHPAGKFLERAWGEPGWTSGAKIVSTVLEDRWTVAFALPLRQLVPGGAKPGQTAYVNVLRGGSENLVCSPTFGEKFHSPARFGALVLR